MKRNLLPVAVAICMMFTSMAFMSKPNSKGEIEKCKPTDVVLELTDSQSRMNFIIEDVGKNKVILCNLEVGATYDLFITQEGDVCASSPLFAEEGNLVQKITITPTTKCHHLWIENFCTTNIGATLSVNKKGSINNDDNGNNFNGPEFVPITTSNAFSAAELIEDVFIGGGCFDVSNVQLIGSSQGVGYFANGAASVGFEDGVVLSTGNIATVSGPNNQGDAGGGIGGGSDSDLAILTSQTINDASGIEFDFSPTLSTVDFNFVFASEEYCEWVNSAFNDVFGFFISGPGINGPFQNGGINIALVPNTNNPITINSVNDGLNSQYFIPNSAGCGGVTNTADIEFDGYTTVLTATANVIPCETYHIRLLVGDGTDAIYDSAVFLEAGSFNAGGQASVSALSINGGGSNAIYEGCGNGVLTFTRETGDINLPLVVTYTISPLSTATLGLDYAPIPFTVTIPPGQTEVSFPITVFGDNLPEGTETIIFELDNSCSCVNNTAEIIINDVQPMISFPIPDQVVCGPQVVSLTSGITGGVPPYQYVWTNGGFGPSINPFVTQTTMFTVFVTDACGNSVSEDVTVEVSDTPTALVSGLGEICPPGLPVTVIQFDFTGNGPWDLIYTINGIPQAPLNGITDNPFILPVSDVGTYEVLLLTSNGCPGQGLGQATVIETNVDPVMVTTDVSCGGNNNGAISVFPLGGVQPYTYLWNSPAAGNTSNPDNLPAGVYTVTVTDGNGCFGTNTATILEPTPMVAQGVGTSADCSNPNGGSISLTVTGGANPLTFMWSNGSTQEDPTGLPPGNYSVLVTDGVGCTTTTSVDVTGNIDPPNAAANAPDLISCNNQQVSINGNGSSQGGNFTYLWTTINGSILSGESTLTPTVGSGGTYEILVTNTSNGCTETASVTVNENSTPPDAIANGFGLLDCNNAQTTLDGNGSSTGGNISYNWTTTDGTIVSGETTLTPIVNTEGTYTLTVLDNSNGCSETTTVQVFGNNNPPTAVSSAPQPLDCNTTTVTVDGTGSSTGTNFSYLWTTTDGSILSGENTLSPQVGSGGTYQILVTDNTNGCTMVSSVMVSENITPPIADAGGQMSIGCAATNLNLDGSASSSGGNLTYIWSTPNGNIVSGENTLTPTVNAAGTYNLTVLNNSTGCNSTASTQVVGSTTLPNANAGASPTLTCATMQTTLDGSSSETGNNISYSWTTQNGNILSGETTVNPTVNGVGVYTLMVTNNDNGCTSISTVEVSENMNTPMAVASAPSSLTCTQTTLSLDGNGSSSGGDFTYLWTTQNGNILSGENTLTPEVNAIGTYQILVTNNTNGCTQTATVNVTENGDLPNADAGTADNLTCDVSEISLNGNGSTGTNFSYLWTTQNGNITSGEMTLTPMINSTGTYELLVTDMDNGCTAVSTVTINENINEPTAVANPTSPLGCTQTSLSLDGSGSSSGGNFTYLWTTQNGSILSGENTLTPEVNAAGTYQILVTNSTNGCTQVATVDVQANSDVPTVDAGIADDLTCSISEITLSGSGSSGANFTYAWTTQNGNILSDETTLNPTINSTGVYELLITNTDNGCTAISTVEVMESVMEPMAVATAPSTLTCTQITLSLDGNGSSSGGDFTYLWTTQNGNILSGENTLTPEVNATGTYQILVTNIANGCTQTATVDVNENGDLPNADAGIADNLTCDILEISLNGNGSTGTNFSYLWTTQNGNITGGEATLNPMINSTGTYELLVTNMDNGCTAVSTVTVDENVNEPMAVANPASPLGCTQTSVSLDGNGSSSGGDFTYLWTTQNGNILSGENTLTPEVNAAGTYEILVTNNTNGCTQVAMVDVAVDGDVPDVNAGVADDLTCSVSEISLSGSGSSGANFTYLWSTQNGNILSDETTLNPTVNSTGVYELLITNTNNGCTAISTVEVMESIDAPMAVANPVAALGCTQTSVSLDGNGSSSGGGFTYLWTTQNGSILSGENTLTPEVNAAGTYEILVTNNINGCTQTATIDVDVNGDLPNVNAGDANDLTCETLEVMLEATASTGNNFSYSWSTQNGNILSDETTLTPTVNGVGTYELLVTNTDNGCTAVSTVTVNENIETPDVQATAAQVLGCSVSEVTLDVANVSPTGLFGYTWDTPNGNIVSGGGTLNPIVSEPGEYILTAVNWGNGCSASISVDVEIDNTAPSVDAGASVEVTCADMEVTLDGSNSASGSNFTYLWTTQNGNIIGGETTVNPTVGTSGTYALMVTNSDNGCTAIADVLVGENFEAPTVNAGLSQTLSCSQTSLQLNGNGSSFGNNFTYQWTTQNGNIMAGENTLTPEINAPGDYELQITNTDNGCVSTSSVNVGQDSNVPTAAAGADDLLNCNVTNLVLDGSASSTGLEFSYNWTTPTGNIVFGENTLTPEIDAAGVYQLVVTNTLNGCTSLSTVEIELDDAAPNAEAGISQFLSCTNNSVSLNGAGSSTADVTYQWVSQNGNILSGENTLTPEVNATGIYELIVTSTLNGCTQSDEVEITQDSSLPTADADIGFEITCDVFEGSLDGTASTVGNDITFEWTTLTGNILSGENTLTPMVDAAGTYQLTLTNSVNGCTAISSVTIVENNNAPTAEAGSPMQLNCNNEILAINGSTIDSSSTLVYEWTTATGNILSGENTLFPEVDAAGTYQLMITNTVTGCFSTDDVTITSNFDAPIANAGATDELNCTQAFATLDGNASTAGANIVYLWTTQNGNIVSGETTLNPEVNMSGDYQLLVTDLANGCTATEIVTITESVDLPSVNAGFADNLTCAVTSLELNGNGSSAGTDFEYLWTTIDGNILSGENTLNPIVDATGTYNLQVTNISNNCMANSTVEVEENLDTPTANAGTEGLLNCTITQTQLDAGNSSIGPLFSYQWMTTSGSIVSGENTLTPTVAGTGAYELIVTNTLTGCTSNSFVNVISNETLPDAVATADDMLTCSETTVSLNGNGSSSGSEYSYQWTTQNGTILSGETSIAPTVGAVGAYTLVVTNTQSGCSNETTVQVEEDLNPPVAAIDQTGNTSLDCITSSIVLDGSGSQPFGNVTYEWTTTNGNILSGANTSNPEVDDDGDYILTVTNLLNGCTATEVITILQDLSVPVVNIDNPLVLTCDLMVIDLDANNSSSGNYSYQWTTQNGNIITGGNTLTPTINQSGTYQLTVIDLGSNCDNVESIIVTENTTPPIAEAGMADILDCQTTSVSLNGSGSSVGNVTYEWTSSNGNIIANTNTLTTTVDAAGAYTLLVTDLQNGCTATDMVTVEEDEDVPNDIIYSQVNPECFGEIGSVTVEAVAGGTPPYLYSLDGIDFYSGHTFTLAEAGEFTLYAQDAAGCETQINFEIPFLTPVSATLEEEATVELGEDYQIQTFTNIAIAEIQSIDWTPKRNLSCTDCLNPIVEQLFDNTTYTVTITNIYGCQVKAKINIIIDKSRAIYIPNVFSPNEDGENDLFMIFAGDLNQIKQVNTFRIFDRWGELVYKADGFMPMDEDYGWNGKLRGKPLNPQVFVYWAEIEFIDGLKVMYKGDVSLRK